MEAAGFDELDVKLEKMFNGLYYIINLPVA